MTDDVKADIKEIKTILKVVIKNMATKEDLKGFATKDDLKSFATKDDLKGFATKDELEELAVSIQKEFNHLNAKIDKCLTKETFIRYWETLELRYEDHRNLRAQVKYNENLCRNKQQNFEKRLQSLEKNSP